MKRSLILTILAVAAMAALTLVLLLDRSPFGSSNSSFSADPSSDITAIHISDSKGELVLENRDGKWMTGGGAEVRRNGIAFITAIVRGMKIKSPVTDDMFIREVTGNGIGPVSVKVYEGRKELTRFLVYRVKSNIYGNIMKVTPRSKPFIVHLPGFEGDIGSVFTSNSLYWQPYVIFNMHPDEIRQISLTNFADTSASFTIITGSGSAELMGNGQILNGWDPQQLKRYISYFTFIAFDEWVISLPEEEKKKIESAVPLWKIEVRTASGEPELLTLWEKTDLSGDSLKTDANRLYGKLTDNGQFFLVRYFDVDPILKKRSYFFTR